MAGQGQRIWMLDDDAELCRLLEPMLTRFGWQVRTFGHPRELEAALEREVPDLLLLDQLLPQKPGTQVLAGLRRAGHRFPVLMLSALGAPTDRVQGLEMGADDYLAKPFLPRELQLRIEVLLRMAGRGPLAPDQDCSYALGPLRFEPARRRIRAADGRTDQLSRGEVAMLLAFCQAPDLVLSREQLARACGTLVDPTSSRSLDVRLSKLRRRLEALMPEPTSPEACTTALFEAVRGRGYRLGCPVSAAPAEPELDC